MLGEGPEPARWPRDVDYAGSRRKQRMNGIPPQGFEQPYADLP
ncbi:hypothetical protein [Streptomyces virginiae]|nr:hypothetical protein [Streptomyces virginiae]MCX5174078.1 hypothetical protein [Streptomyces virginiae]